jgi:hypothetical protein
VRPMLLVVVVAVIGHGGRCCFLLRFGSTKLTRDRRLIFVFVRTLE